MVNYDYIDVAMSRSCKITWLNLKQNKTMTTLFPLEHHTTQFTIYHQVQTYIEYTESKFHSSWSEMYFKCRKAFRKIQYKDSERVLKHAVGQSKTNECGIICQLPSGFWSGINVCENITRRAAFRRFIFLDIWEFESRCVALLYGQIFRYK